MVQQFGTAMWQVTLIGVILGAGLPALFALGVRFTAAGVGGDAEEDHRAGSPASRVIGAVCFAVVLAGVLLGIAIAVSSGFGYSVSFEHVWPAFVKKGH